MKQDNHEIREIREMNTDTERRAPDLTLEFPECDYSQALTDYYDVRMWVLAFGLCSRKDILGVINSPAFGAVKMKGAIPADKLDKKGWRVTVDFWGDEQSIPELKDKTLPRRATWRTAA